MNVDILRVLASRIAGRLRSGRLDADFDAELRVHLAMLEDDLIRRGLPPERAAREARLRLGGVTQLAEAHREQRAIAWVDTLSQDVRYALRTFARQPTFAAVAILTLALGIGVNTTVFTLFDAVALKRLPVRDPNRVFRLERWIDSGQRGDIQFAYSYPEYLKFRDHSRALSGVVAASWPIRVVGDVDTLSGQLVSDNYFDVLGVGATVGRALHADDRTGEPAIVLSHPFWQRRYDSDPRIVGAKFRLNDGLYTVVGVAPPSFIGTGNPPGVPDFWAPLALQPRLQPVADWLGRDAPLRRLQLLGRLAPEAAVKRAEAEALLLVTDGAGDAQGEKTIAVTLEPSTLFGEVNDPRFRLFASLVMTIVGMVLLIACANLANMTMARTVGRQREIGVRLALGAGRPRVVRQLLTEALILALAGGAVAFVLSTWACRWLWLAVVSTVQGMFGAGLPLVVELTPDMRVFVYTLGASTIAGLLFGLSPALQSSKADLTAALRDEATALGVRFSRSRLRGMLVAGQVAAATMLLITSGLFARGVVRSQITDPGFETSRVFYVAFDRGDPVRAPIVQHAVVERLRTTPAVRSVALVERVPLRGTWSTAIADARTPDRVRYSLANRVSSGYFDTLGIAVDRGRTFTARESETAAPVAVVSATTARTLWPNEDPIGQRLRVRLGQRRTDPTSAEMTIVGVVHDVRSANVSRIDPLMIYLPTTGTDVNGVLIRADGDARRALGAARAAVEGVDRRLLASVQVMSLADGPLRQQRLLPDTIARAATMLAALALALAGIGIYGVMAYLVSQRVREIGVRMALGATAPAVVRQVIGQGLRPVAAGAAIGIVAAAGASAFLRATLAMPSVPDLLFGVGAFDPLTFAGVTAFVALVALIASAVPARRAATVDPMTALRCE